jgi:hypothetical protein
MAQHIWIVECLAEEDSYILQACNSEDEATSVVARCLQFDVDMGLEYQTVDEGDDQLCSDDGDGDGDGDIDELHMQEYEGEGAQGIYRIRKLEISKFYGYHNVDITPSVSTSSE